MWAHSVGGRMGLGSGVPPTRPRTQLCSRTVTSAALCQLRWGTHKGHGTGNGAGGLQREGSVTSSATPSREPPATPALVTLVTDPAGRGVPCTPKEEVHVLDPVAGGRKISPVPSNKPSNGDTAAGPMRRAGGLKAPGPQ